MDLRVHRIPASHVELGPLASAPRMPLTFQITVTPVAVSVGGHYAIKVHHGNHGARYLCWFYPEPQKQQPKGLFAMRVTLDDAMADAQHHALTGEVRR